MHDLNPRPAAEGAALSLVKGTKSSTPPDLAQCYDLEENPHYTDLKLDESVLGKYLVVRQTWDGCYRGTAVVEVKGRKNPPRHFGDRISESLSGNAKRRIDHSSRYLATQKRGFRVFATMTLDLEARKQIEAWDNMPRYAKDIDGKRILNPDRHTLGSQVTKFLNAMQQRFKKGLTLPAGCFPVGKLRDKEGRKFWETASGQKYRVEYAGQWQRIKHYEEEKIAGDNTPFDYIWVIENPTNENGEANPHIHFMMNWSVNKDQFRRWAAWMENLWGKGWVKLERLRQPKAAAAYMAKAANYISKGTDGSQGEVRGNRYFISKKARAPEARLVGVYKLFELHQIIRTGYHAYQESLANGTNRKGMYFTRWSFGASDPQQWGELCTTLKHCGFRFEEYDSSSFLWGRFCNNVINASYRSTEQDWDKSPIDTTVNSPYRLYDECELVCTNTDDLLNTFAQYEEIQLCH